MEKLFSPLSIKNITLKNRIVMSPMCQYSSQDGFANDWHFVHYSSRAVGGCGLIMVEACAVNPVGRISPDDLGLWKDEQIDGLAHIVNFAEEQNCVCAIQLAHAGRKASVTAPFKGGEPLKIVEGGWQTVAPSDYPFAENYPTPIELNVEQIKEIVDDFGSAAKRAAKAGFKIFEIHAAHGYLIHEFLSPLSNFRSDIYGGSLENRARILFEIVEKIKENTPFNSPIFVRISATDWVRGGWDLEESVKLSSMLSERGVDLIDVSTGGLIEGAKVPVDFGYQIKFAEEIKRRANIATSAVGLIISPAQAETILANGQADLVDIGRELLRNPYFALHAARELGAKVKVPPQYELAIE